MKYGETPQAPFRDVKLPVFPDVDQNYVTSIDQEALLGEPLPDRAKIRRVLKHYNHAADGVARQVIIGDKTLRFDQRGWTFE